MSKYRDRLEMRFFVLTPYSSDPALAYASREGMRAYARAIQQEFPALANELHEWSREAELGHPARPRTPEAKE